MTVPKNNMTQVVALIENGADINHKWQNNQTGKLESLLDQTQDVGMISLLKDYGLSLAGDESPSADF